MSSYPAEFSDETEAVRLAGSINFPDPENQPATANQPFKPAAGDTVTVVEDAAGDPVYVYDDDAGTHSLTGKLIVSGDTRLDADLLVSGEINADSLGPVIPYVTVQAAAPTTYQTPIVVDTTAVTGATYAWDGSAYQKIADLLT